MAKRVPLLAAVEGLVLEYLPPSPSMAAESLDGYLAAVGLGSDGADGCMTRLCLTRPQFCCSAAFCSSHGVCSRIAPRQAQSHRHVLPAHEAGLCCEWCTRAYRGRSDVLLMVELHQLVC